MFKRQLYLSLAKTEIRSDEEQTSSFNHKIEAMTKNLYDQFHIPDLSVKNFKKVFAQTCLEKIAETMRLETTYVDLPEPFRGYTEADIAEYSDGSFELREGKIKINRNISKERQRFSLAHELGHVLLGHLDHLQAVTSSPRALYKSDVPLSFVRAYYRQQHTANYFAATLLLPRHQFLDSVWNNNFELDKVASEFGVTYHTVAHRLVSASIDMPFHLIVVRPDRKVEKAFSADETRFSFGEFYACQLSSAVQCFLDENRVHHRFSNFVNGDVIRSVYCFSKVSDDFRQNKIAISVGCNSRHSSKFKGALAASSDFVCEDCLYCPDEIKTRHKCIENHFDLSLEVIRQKYKKISQFDDRIVFDSECSLEQ